MEAPTPPPPRPTRILLGVTGSIAAYKACELVRLCIRRGWEVRVIMTEAATRFVTPLSFRTLSRNPVGLDAFAEPASWEPEHISLAEWADLLVIAPCSANTLAGLAHGFANNLLLSTALACRAPLVIAPAMNTGMWEAPATQENLRLLQQRGATLLSPDSGELACGTVGKGRMPSPESIAEALSTLLFPL